MAKIPSPAVSDKKIPRARRPEPAFHRMFHASSAEVRRVLIELPVAFQSKVEDETLGRAELVLAEVLNNIVKHGHTAEAAPMRASELKVHLSITSHDMGLCCAILDNGPVLPLECLNSPQVLGDLDRHNLPEGGFGWLLIRDLSQKLCYYRENDHNILALTIAHQNDRGPKLWDP